MNLIIRYLGYVIGFVFGVYLFEILVDLNREEPTFIAEHAAEISSCGKTNYNLWLKNKGFVVSKIDQDELSFGKSRTEMQKSLESELLYNLVYVTCVVFVIKPERAYMVANTWGRHCNSLLFYSNTVTKLDYLDVHIIPLKSSWQFMCECIRHLWLTEKHLQWVIFSFDDIYVVPENLRYFLAIKDYNDPYYYGHNVYFWNVLYNSEETGFVLSKGSIRALVNKFSDVSSCEKSERYRKNGDFYLGKYLTELNITAGNARDEKGRERFHILKLEILLASDSQTIVQKYSKKSVWPIKLGKDCCSDSTISFPTSGNNLLTHYLIYQVKVFHSGKLGNRLKNETEDPEAWKDIVQEEFGNDLNMSIIDDAEYYRLWQEKIKILEKKRNFV
ncbi:glycoprotein-N-acetylgalactosamine 3-beta-galactosyltransferase 1 isoform X1 [Halyomorpha halys]|uniref:glycoprotein-N-acetylgalactosamine 3-beta-galactosyltransferase 1 isoform X1 n=1 Tax=Halyomorpha halys TaxID=286706 RepID=UPI0006D4E1DB|nr:glycoprotein-N-acetylgalactosamine 3-beta-galactosyltransferase 1-like isoform X1 [Halyomorpha halys]